MAKKFLPPAFEMAEKASFLGSSASISFAFDGKCLKCGCRADHEPAGKRSYTCPMDPEVVSDNPTTASSARIFIIS